VAENHDTLSVRSDSAVTENVLRQVRLARNIVGIADALCESPRMSNRRGRLGRRAAFDVDVPSAASEGRRDTEPAVSTTVNVRAGAAGNERRVQSEPRFQRQSSRHKSVVHVTASSQWTTTVP
jgi:hypothetical protein